MPFLQWLLLVSNFLYHCAVFSYLQLVIFTVNLDCTPSSEENLLDALSIAIRLHLFNLYVTFVEALVNNRPAFHADARLVSIGQEYSSPLTQVYVLSSPIKKAMLSSSHTIIHKRS